MRILKILSVIWISVCARAQPTHLMVTSASINTGAYSRNFMDAFSFDVNPASLAGVKSFLGGIIAESKWMLPELTDYNLAVSAPLGNGGIGILLKRSGDTDYYEQGYDLAYGKNLGRVELGIRFGFLEEKASGYSGNGFGNSGLGIRIRLTDNLITGWGLDLPVFGKAGKSYPEKGPQSFRMGFGYEWEREIFLCLEIKKISGYPVNVFGSVEYRYAGQFLFSFGLNSSTGAIVFQSGWSKKQCAIQIYTAFEPELGFSPGLIILWNGKSKKE